MPAHEIFSGHFGTSCIFVLNGKIVEKIQAPRTYLIHQIKSHNLYSCNIISCAREIIDQMYEYLLEMRLLKLSDRWKIDINQLSSRFMKTGIAYPRREGYKCDVSFSCN